MIDFVLSSNGPPNPKHQFRHDVVVERGPNPAGSDGGIGGNIHADDESQSELNEVMNRIIERKPGKYRYRTASNGKLIKIEDDTSDEESDCHSSSQSYGRNDEPDWDSDDAAYGAQLYAQYHAGWE